MKNKLFSILLLSMYSLLGYSQGYQKSFGIGIEQQELYSICNNDSSSLIVSGTFKNIATFPEIAFYGTVSKVNKTGAVEWYKGYLPTNFIPFESFLITSVLKAGNGDTYCIGSFLSLLPNTGYILMRLNANGQVLFAKKILDEDVDLHPKAVLKEDFIYVSLYDKIVKFDLNGVHVEAKKFEHLTFRDINLDQNNNIILTGEYLNSDSNSPISLGCPVLTLDGNLQLLSGNVYTTQSGMMYGQAIVATDSNQLLVAGPGAYFCVNTNGQIAWAKELVPFSTPVPETVDGYDHVWDLQKIADGTIVSVLSGFFSNSDGIVWPLDSSEEEDSFQHYSAISKIDPTTGLIISSRDIKAGHFLGINHIEVNNLLLDNGSIYTGGTTSDYYGEYKLNYLHQTDLNDLNCGELTRSVTVENWSDQILPAVTYQSSSITNAALLISDITMIAVDIPINYNNQSCSQTLTVNEPSISATIAIYPNPVENILTIDTISSIEEVKVFDVLGKEMQVLKLSETSYDLSILTKGIYIIQIKDTYNGITTHRVIKK